MSSTPCTNELVILGAPVTLRDGSRGRVRQAHRSDKQLQRRGFEHLGPESRYRRFLAPMPQLTEEMVRYLTEVDHHDHEAIIALEEETGEGIGMVRYVRGESLATGDDHGCDSPLKESSRNRIHPAPFRPLCGRGVSLMKSASPAPRAAGCDRPRHA